LKALYEQDLLPNIIAGSSAGALIGAVLCSHKYSELGKLFDPYYIWKKDYLYYTFNTIWEALDLLKQGKPLFDTNQFKQAVQFYTGDLTFLEMY
jgi:NTE family protein